MVEVRQMRTSCLLAVAKASENWLITFKEVVINVDNEDPLHIALKVLRKNWRH